MTPSLLNVYRKPGDFAMKDKRVLIIDDQMDFGFLMEAFFAHKGSTVFLANSMSEGLRILQEEAPDFTFLDNNLPKGFGWSKAEFIQASYPQTQLILITAKEFSKTSSTFRMLYKPFLKDELRKMFP
ncbi:MAG: response regulator [Cyclobacteriaceae bacterium]